MQADHLRVSVGGDEREKTVKEHNVGAMRKKKDPGGTLQENRETTKKDKTLT